MNIIGKITDKANVDLKIEIYDAEQKEHEGEKKKRECLRAKWIRENAKNQKIVAIGINPSTAHNDGKKQKSDITITKLCRFLDMHGFDNLTMLNLYENVSSTQLNGKEKIITDFETKREELAKSDIILVAWGCDSNKELRELKKEAGKVLAEYADKLYCIRKSNGNCPAHPSRISYKWDIVSYDINIVQIK